MRALNRNGETDSETESSIRLADLEALVCDLLRQNQTLREELATFRPRARLASVRHVNLPGPVPHSRGLPCCSGESHS
jgi:hypothetical protein